ncbi:hypothetical protein [Streptomyces sp. NPDC051561]|uniref:hypothetical protein n=1 Tax=Streptomyces sp. NPDC051561 TaxID=3365658 RepID=UPI0037B58105
MTREQLATEAPEADGTTVRSPRQGAPGAARRRKVRAAVVTGAVAGVVALGVVVALAVDGGGDAQEPTTATPPATGVAADPGQSPPRKLVAAGRVAVSGYYTTKSVTQSDGNGSVEFEWNLINSTTGTYAKGDWSWVDIAPGMRTAVVLEKELPAKRVGLLDLATHKVTRWIKVDKGVGGVRFSPDGKRLVATAYSADPDRLYKEESYQVNDTKVPGPKPSRTGFYVIDVASGKAEFTARPPKKNERGYVVGGGRQDMSWNRDGTVLWEPWSNKAGKVFVEPGGREVPVPKTETGLGAPGSVLSPDKKLVTGEFVGTAEQVVSEVRDVKTGKRAALVPGQQLLAWADDDALIAWRCEPKQCSPGKGEFRNQLVLAGLDGESVTPLTGFRRPSLKDDDRWNPIFTKR